MARTGLLFEELEFRCLLPRLDKLAPLERSRGRQTMRRWSIDRDVFDATLLRMPKSPLEATRELHAALEAGKHGADLRAFFTEDATTLEHPNLIKPRGGTGSLESMLAASTAGAGLLAKQRYVTRSAIEHDDLAIVRLTWTGVIARDVGSFRAGQVLTAQIAQFITVRDGRISAIETYDCYEPLPSRT